MKILLIEDDRRSAAHTLETLEQRGHSVRLAEDGRAGLKLAISQEFDVLILDRMLPQLEGLDVVRALRTASVRTPVLVLTALGGMLDRVEGLDAGADDYLAKPFAPAELLARVQALARRQPLEARPTRARAGELEIDLVARSVRRGARDLALTRRQFDILAMLMRHAGRVVTRAMLLEEVFDLDPSTDSRGALIETHVSHLRAKVDAPGEEPLIRTVRGVGYSIRAD